MDNLLQETISSLSNNWKDEADVMFITDWINSTSWKKFIKMANFEYDWSFNYDVVNSWLKIVGKDWWLERGRDDGYESWSFKEIPNKLDDGDLEIKNSAYLDYNYEDNDIELG